MYMPDLQGLGADRRAAWALSRLLRKRGEPGGRVGLGEFMRLISMHGLCYHFNNLRSKKKHDKVIVCLRHVVMCLFELKCRNVGC